MKDLILSPISLGDLKTAISEAVKDEFEKYTSSQNPKSETEYITRKQAAGILGISLPTLNEWSKQGIIPSYRISSRVRYKKAEVESSLHKVQSVKYNRGN